jgi:acetyl/propionyl-CoA carboxylase alpha subunit
MHTLYKILIANRGEIALRIQRAAHAMGIRTVAVFSAGEENAPHVTKAGEAVYLGEGSLNDTYLNIDKIINAAKTTGAEAIHPGYGFLSESHLLATACLENGIRFIGPSPEVLRLMGNKLEAKALAESLQIPVLWNKTVNAGNVTDITDSLSFPVLIKSAHGGGGKGMQVARSAAELEEKVTRASRMAFNYFGNGEVYLEPYIEKARHIEVQVLGDSHGNLVHLFERECTLQRNYQKIIEEAPAPNLTDNVRHALLDAAIKLCTNVNYSGAGTVEFILDQSGDFYFMEMNPRIQVEHPVTEEITGIDIVHEQLRIASGKPLSFRQEEVRTDGHAFEVRIYSEDPEKGFAPSTHPVTFARFPSMTDVRLETDLTDQPGAAVNQFDPLLCKLITTGKNRGQALERMLDAINQTVIEGPVTNQHYLRALLQHPDVETGLTDTRFCENNLNDLLSDIWEEKESVPAEMLIAAFLYLKFLPVDSTSRSPWARMGYRNIFNQVDIRMADQHCIVPFSLLSVKNQESQNRAIRAELEAGAVAFSFTWKTSHLTAVARLTGDQTVKVTTKDASEDIVFRENQSGKTLFYWHGFDFASGSHDLLEYYPKTGRSLEKSMPQGDNIVYSPLHGKVIDIPVKTGQVISKGDLLVIIESMKSENHITAHKSGKINSIEVSVGTQVSDHMPLVSLE